MLLQHRAQATVLDQEGVVSVGRIELFVVDAGAGAPNNPN